MRACCLILAAVLLACVWAGPAPAMHEWEVWRSPFGKCNGLAVNPSDGTAWASLGDRVYHYAADQTFLSKTELWAPQSLGVDARDGSCWVVEGGPHDYTYASAAVLRLAGDGTEQARVSGFDRPTLAASAGPDGSLWVATNIHLWRLSASGQIVVARTQWLMALAANAGDGTCWVLDRNQYDSTHALVHLSTDGSVLWHGGTFAGDARPEDVAQHLLAVNPTDNSVWVADRPNGDLVHVSEAGDELARTHFPDGVYRVTLDPRDATCWVSVPDVGVAHVATDGSVLETVPGPSGTGVTADPTGNGFWGGGGTTITGALGPVVRYASDGTEVWRTGESLGGNWFSQADHSCWIWSSSGELLRVTGKGDELWRGVPYGDPYSSPAMAVNPADGSLYFVFAHEAVFLRLALDGTETWVPLTYAPAVTVPAARACALAVNAADGSFWAYVGDTTDVHGKTVAAYTHFAADGSQAGVAQGMEADPSCDPAVDPADGSVWVTGTASGTHWAAHFASDGSLLWRQALPVVGPGLCLDPTDGSCWMGGTDALRLFAKDGTLLVQIPVCVGSSLAVDPHTHACWASEGGPSAYVSVFDRAGTRLWICPGFAAVDVVRADRDDGSLWVSGGLAQVVHLWAPTTPFSDVLPGNWAGRAIRMCYEYGIVGGYPDGGYQPLWPVSRAQMAGFVARALAGGDSNVPPGPETPHFPDVATDYWAYKYIEYAYANSIVAGYPGGNYVPELAVDRGQMAAFIARAIVSPTGEEGLASYTPPATPTFPDVPTDFWTYKHIEYIRSQGIVGGYPDGLYHPGELCTRDQMAVFIARAFDLLPY